MAEESERLAFVPETVLKKRKHGEEKRILKNKLFEQKRVNVRKNKNLLFKRAEQFIREFRMKELDLQKMRWRKKSKKNMESDSKLLFVIRICRRKDIIHPKIKKVLSILRLPCTFSGVFIKSTPTVLHMLRIVAPYVTYGYPSLSNVKDLIVKKGVVKKKKEMMPLVDNNIVEEVFGKRGIICVGDVVKEVFGIGPHFDEVSLALCPFVLGKPEGVFSWKKHPFSDGGETGDRKHLISQLISRMI